MPTMDKQVSSVTRKRETSKQEVEPPFQSATSPSPTFLVSQLGFGPALLLLPFQLPFMQVPVDLFRNIILREVAWRARQMNQGCQGEGADALV